MGKTLQCCNTCSTKTKEQDKNIVNFSRDFQQPQYDKENDPTDVTIDQPPSHADSYNLDYSKFGDSTNQGQSAPISPRSVNNIQAPNNICKPLQYRTSDNLDAFVTPTPVENILDKNMTQENKYVKQKNPQSPAADPVQNEQYSTNLRKNNGGMQVNELPNEHLIHKENFEIHPDGTTYSGQMKVVTAGRLGDGTVKYENATFDSQDQLVFIPHGKGTLRWADGASYTGDIEDGKANGRGKFSHANGDSYIGDFKDDQAHGFGEYIYHEQQQKYSGQWQNDMQHGQGREELSDNSVYEGTFKEGQKDGQGRYIWPDGSSYEGQWYNNEMCGYGIFVASDQRQYLGMYKDSQFNGKGFYKWPDGRTYQGYYLNDKKEGFGIYCWPDGKEYQGFWSNGVQEGVGQFKNTKNQIRVGMWKQGKRVAWIKDEEEQQALVRIESQKSKMDQEDQMAMQRQQSMEKVDPDV